MSDIEMRLEYLRGEIEKECISLEEIAELQSLVDFIKSGDVLLLEWAGVPENILLLEDGQDFQLRENMAIKIKSILEQSAKGEIGASEFCERIGVILKKW